MKNRSLLAVFLLFFPITALSQNLFTRKDMAFTQIAVGVYLSLEYETVLNITNRGITTYNGTLRLFSGGQAWNPLVNENAITNGEMAIILEPGVSATFRITGSGSIETGFATIESSTWELTNFVEGTLTYYVRSGGMLVDSIGIQPSSEIYLTTIPFDDFSTIALALANANLGTANVQLRLFSATNQLMDTVPLPLLPNQHYQKYLREISGITLTNGRLEIQSDIPILATVLTDVNNQFSSLPLLPGVKAYTFTANMTGMTISGEWIIWIEGITVVGYMRTTNEDGQPLPPDDIWTVLLTGQLFEGALQLYFSAGDLDPGDVLPSALIAYAVLNPFSLSPGTVIGSLMFLWNDFAVQGPGILSITAIN